MVTLTTAETGLLKRRLYDYAKTNHVAIPKLYQRLVPTWGGASRRLCKLVTTRMGYTTPIQNPDAHLLYVLRVRKAPPVPTTIGHKALKWLGEHRIREVGANNRGAALDAWWREYGHGPAFLGEPWCGLTVWEAFYHGAGVDLRSAGVVYTPSATANARANTHQLHILKPSEVQEGDIAIFDWQGMSGDGVASNNPASASDHIAITRGPVNFKAGNVRTREGNTQPGNTGDQSGRDGRDVVADRIRALSYVICFCRVVPSK